MIILRKYTNKDFDVVARLFYETVHTVNAADYSVEQLFAWANSADSLKSRRDDLLQQNTLLAEIDSVTVGFGSIDNFGCLDMLFVHKDYQRRGIATALCNDLEQGFADIKVYASMTAKPFFEKRGYRVIKSQEVEHMGIKLRNFEMKKSCD